MASFGPGRMRPSPHLGVTKNSGHLDGLHQGHRSCAASIKQRTILRGPTVGLCSRDSGELCGQVGRGRALQLRDVTLEDLQQ